MIQTLLDACRFVLEDQGEAQSSYWLASIMLETKLWRANESQVRVALDRDIEEHGESTPVREGRRGPVRPAVLGGEMNRRSRELR
jgi:hypothetical protein